MNLPGFTAEASLGNAMADYSSSSVALFGRGVVASSFEAETFNCGPCSELRARWKGSGACTKCCCDSVSGQNCQFQSCKCPTKAGRLPLY